MNKDLIYLNMAKEMAKLSHCVKIKVAALIVKDGRILSTGINGTPAGTTNCDEKFDAEFDRDLHHEFSTYNEIHAEMNAIIFAAKYGVSIDGATLYSVYQPCRNCLKHILNAGIKYIVYSEDYDLAGYTADTYNLLKTLGVQITQVTAKP
ncbi:MAG: deaminase [Spirochaetaceae bacterium]|nr:deaminase [Spirochaetaceae bacterium]